MDAIFLIADSYAIIPRCMVFSFPTALTSYALKLECITSLLGVKISRNLLQLINY